MTPEQRIKKLEDDLKKIQDILFGIADDTRFKAKIRRQIFAGEHTTNKPTIVNQDGKRYNVNTV